MLEMTKISVKTSVFQDAVLVVVGGGVLHLRVDIGAHRLNRLQFVLADAPVDDLLKSGIGVERPLSIVTLHEWER